MIATKRTKKEILQDITIWEKKTCAKCKVKSWNQKQKKCNCKGAVKLRSLGDELNATTRTTNEEKVDRLFKQAEKCWNLDNYYLLKEFGVTEKEIQNRLGFTAEVFTEWRRVSGIPIRKGNG